MDCNCNCFGVAAAARVPVKRYNLLVPDVFPVVEPSFDKPLGITVERKIKKLAEYLDKNEHRAPKVSRRLQRRLYAELRARNFGYVKLAVETYAYLLKNSRPEKSNLLANELVVRTVVKRRRLLFGMAGRRHFIPFREPHLGSAVGLLLTHESPRLRKLGVDLLIDFIKCQSTSDYVPQLEAFVPLLCENALPRKPLVTAAAVGSPGSVGSLARVSSKAAAAAAAAWEAEDEWSLVRAGCLRALLEHLRFCARLSYVSYHLHTITFAVLACVDASGRGAPQGRYMSPRAALQSFGEHELARLNTISRGSISHAIGASPPDVAALLVFEELAHMTRDAAEGKKVLEFVMRFLDGRHRWLGSPVVETSIAVLQQACEQEHQRYLLFSTLLRHVATAEQLAPAERAAVLALAVAEGRQLEAGLAAPALLLALRELPAVIASTNSGPGEGVPPMPSASPPATPPAATLAPLGGSSAATAAAGAAAAQQEFELPRLQNLRHVSPTAAAVAAAPANLQPQVLAAISQLAQQVQDSTQLVEAVSSTITKLRGAAPISTAALQCCVVAAQAVQVVPPKMPRGGGSSARTFPSLLLQELAGIMVHWGPQQRLLAHALLLQLLPAAPGGLKEQQASILLSALWHEAGLSGNRPAAFVAADRTLAALLCAAPVAALPQAVTMLAALQLEVLQAGSAPAAPAAGVNGGAAAAAAMAAGAEAGGDGSRLAGLPAAHACALLRVCQSALHMLAVQLGQPALEKLAAPDCKDVLPRLAVGPAEEVNIEDGEGAGQDVQRRQWEQFWQAPAAVREFSADEQQCAAAFLADWRRSASAAQQEDGLAAVLAAVPLFKQVAAGGGRFQPMAAAALMPRLMQVDGASYANGSASSSKRAQRLRSVYKHMRQTSLLDGDRVALATISQESATEEVSLPALQLLELPGMPDSGAAAQAARPQSVDDVLADVDAALAAAEAAMARGCSPSPATLNSLGVGRGLAGGSSSSIGSGDTPAAAAGGQSGGNHLSTGMVTLYLEPIDLLGLRQPAEWQSQDPPDAPPLAVPDEPSQESLLSEDLSGMSLSLLPGALVEAAGDIQCCADELEAQAKLLEDEWFCPSQPPAAAAAAAKAQQSFRLSAAVLGAPALRHGGLNTLQRQLALQEEQQRKQQEQQQQQQRQQEQQQQQQAAECAGAGECCGEAAGAVREEPATPQRHSKGESCWSESPLSGSPEEFAEVQSPAPAKLVVLSSPASLLAAVPSGPLHCGCLPPLALSIHNALCVRLGQEPPAPGAWRGCGRSAWCSHTPRHRGACNASAVLPGLLAYPSQELFESGVNIEELCRVPEELISALAPDSESGGEGGAACGSAATAADCLSSGKRQREGEADADGCASPSASGCGAGAGGSASSGGAADSALAAIKRLRTDASSPASLAGYSPVALTAGVLQPSPAAVAAAAAEVAAAVCPRMVPVAVPTPVAVPQFAPPVPLPAPSMGAAFFRNRGRPAGAPRLRPLPRVEPPPAPPPAPVAPTPSKPVTRQKNHSPATGAAVAPRTSGRRTVMQWHTESVIDPRTGASVTEVQPGTFCTQCYALSTPVWRAGPFGHKTLCNACGVRWMKASKGSKK
ncbi:hypothetical protein ABPG75_013334 [Micractinium tetrahymenae]